MRFECSVEGCKFVAARHAQALAHIQAHKRMIELTNAFETFVEKEVKKNYTVVNQTD